jgi:hypothetical protein
MKSFRLMLSAVVLTSLAVVAFGQAEAQKAQTDSQKAFEKLKTLAGSWEGQGGGHAVRISNRITSGGSALMSELQGQENMVSMLHLDGDRLMLTHYCPMGNQPRLVGMISPDGKTITFSFLDATNLLTSQEGHLTRAVFTLIDSDHHTESYEFSTADGKTMKELLDLHRAK